MKTTLQGITSIIVLTYNKLDYNKLCIESIRQYTEPDSYEVIVIDNHSTDGTVEWLQGQQDIRLILNSENVGFPAGCNQGLKAAKGNSVLLLNNDTVVTPNWLSNLKKCLYSSNDIGAVGAVTNSCSNFQSIPCEYSSIEEMIGFSRQVNNSDPELWEDRARLVGYCMLIKAEIINKIGLLEEAFSPGNYEDDDYCLRIRNAGYRLVLCRDTFIHHFGSVTFGEQTNQYNSLLKANRQKFVEKWGLAPHLAAPCQQTQDLAARKWFTYQHEISYYKQWVENTRRKFRSFIDQAEFALLSGDFEKTALLVKQAAEYAQHSHPGFFVSPRLELILRKVAKKLNDRVAIPTINLPPRNIEKRNILHVLSQGYAAGGQTRTLERWICMDSASVHSIIVTLNSTTNPQCLEDAAIHSGGWYITLDTARLSLCQKAKVLRDAATMWADLVVLHIHPHDPVAPIAFGVAGGPPVVFVNHADHSFSIGMTVADLVAEHSEAGQLLTLTRRCHLQSYIVPIPIEMPQTLVDKHKAKEIVGISKDGILFLTFASPYKLVSCGEYNIFALFREIASRNQNVEILVLGPSDCGEWAKIKNDSNGRIRAVGHQQDLSQFYNAADVYLDSIPLGSVATALEAGAFGIPVVGLIPEAAEYLSNNIAPGVVRTHHSSIDEFLEVIGRLSSDEDYRLNQGRRLQATICKNHCSGWIEHIGRLYSLLPFDHKPSEILDTPEQKSELSDIVLAYFQHRSGLSRSSFGV
ncbi:hypothetical protein SPSIL_050840 [Sporomusa silvacetica DSM 10669]|uniref:Glycosyltransferase 2-like domain-containing protein n=1 Tax=Sporomusa silvacetica DSM 10669 TaxID=1123289 RepID=A0ABZ3IT12_9FIRM|nr:glycosyltransferase [Sporomusa silvacetica]OZC16602.1 putative glycosyltransferase EpsH [Sporomusa silvacetica DSM 10669]